MNDHSTFEFVIASSVRVDLLQMVSSGPVTTDELIEELDASQSAVYTALTDLGNRTVVFESDDGWELTGQGRLILDVIEQSQATERLLSQDREYWETHRTDVLPPEFRHRLPELGDYEVVRSEPPNVRAHSQAVVSQLESAEYCHTAVPIHVPEYADAFPNNPDSRLIFPPRVIDHLQEEVEQGRRNSVRAVEHVSHRVGPIQFGFTAAPEFMMLALQPQRDNPVESVLISTDDSAIQWARDLHESLWQDAEPLDSYLGREH